ncbi:N,N'-diacetylchitobiose transport system permease protein [Streptacidiphilus sp. MAP12-20]|uniref:carbohydrate ABC transporter permease n=1 Tax=Streptacidiphilus sp. MAP12-20 TaxID=3156299 RepID=UPI00351927E8
MATTTESHTAPPAPTGAAARPPRRARRPRRHGHALPYLLLLPATAVLALVLGYPLVRLVIISFQDYGLRALFTGVITWAGLANYQAVWQDPQLLPVLARTGAFCAALVAGTLVIGLLVALMMARLGPRMRTAVTLCLITSWAMPPVAATLVWQWLFQPVYGVVNWLLTQTGLFGDLTQHDWTTSALSAFAIVWLLVVWQSVPFVALTLYAGLSQIPRSYYEAAAIDGAGAWTVFRVITLPFLRPILVLVTILSVIWDFNIFTQIWILTQGGPGGGTTTLGIWSFTKAFSGNSFGQGAAIAVVSVLLLLVLTLYYVRRLVRSGEDL